MAEPLIVKVTEASGQPLNYSQSLFKIGGETPGAAGTLFAVPALGPGDSFSVQRLEQLIVAQGYINTATADYNGDATETDEANNTTTDNYVVTP